jgi:hypothetical protein
MRGSFVARPKLFKDFLRMLKIFNFSLQFLRPECSVGSWGLFENQIVALIAPLFVLLFFEVVYRVRMLESIAHRDLVRNKEAMAQYRAEGKRHQYHSVAQFFIMMSLFYTKTLLAPFDCSDSGAGPVVDGYTDIKCSMNGAYLKVLIPAGIGLMLYVLMFIHCECSHFRPNYAACAQLLRLICSGFTLAYPLLFW